MIKTNESRFTHTIVSARFTRLSASVVIVIGLLVLFGWLSGLMFLTRSSVNEVPMAPSTAYVFILIAVGLWFYLRPQKVTINRKAATASALLAISLPCLLVITNLLKYYGNWEHAFIKIPENQLSMQLGHMSLITALLFIISGFALLFLQSKRKIVRTFSIILTLFIFTISFTLLLGYGFGAPFFYFDNFIPPAVLTVLSFLLVSLGLIAASNKNTFLVKTIWKQSTSAKLLRVFLPATIAITVIESLIVNRVLPLLNIHPAIGVSLVSLLVVVAVIVVITIISKSMGKTLDTALENLNESEAKFRAIFEQAGGYSMILDPNTEDGIPIVIDANEAALTAHGYTREELIGSPVAVIDDEEGKKLVKERTALIMTGKPFFVENVHVRKDGTIFHVAVNAQRIDIGDNPPMIFTTEYDITEKKRDEILLRNEKRRLRTILDMVENPIFVKDNDHRITLANQAFYKMFKMAEKDVIGYTLVEAVPEQERDQFLQVDRKVLDTGERDQREEELTIDGFTNTIITSKLRFTDEFDSKFLVCSIQDITERKQSEKDLIESEAQLRIITDNLPILISQIDKDLKYTFANKYYYDVGELQDSMIGKKVVDIIGKETFNRAYPNMQKALSGEQVSFENRYLNKKNNKLLIMESHFIPYVVNDQVESFFVLAIDITERKLAEEKIRTVQENLKNTFDISPSIISTVNVETGYFVAVNQAVTSILGYSVEEITSKPLIEFIHPDDRQRTADLILELIEGNKATFFENRYFCKDGSIKWLAWNATIADKNSIVTAIANDITERKLAAEDLARTRALLSETEKSGKIGGWKVDLDTMAQTWTEETYHIHEVDMDFEPDVSKGINFYAPASRPIIKHAFNHTVETGEPFDLELELITAKGNRIWVNSVGKAQQIEGVTKVVSGSFQDITERKLAELALKESEENLKNTFDLSPSIISKANIDTGYFIEANQAVTRLLGYTIEEFTSTPIIEMIHPDDIQRTTDEIEEQLKGKEITFFENRYLCKNGSYKWMAWHGTKADKHGIITAIGSDIAKRKQAEQKILEALEKLSNAEVIAKMGNWSWNPNTNEVLWSDNMCRLYGIEPSEFDPTFDYANRYTHPDDLDYVSKIIERLLTEKKPQPSAEYRILTPDNKTVWVEGSTKILFDEKGEISEIVGTTQDITERKQIQETIMAKSKEMENYLYIASHDLRTPLVNIQGFSQRLKKQTDSIKSLFTDKTLEPETAQQLGLITDENIPKTLSFVFSSVQKMDALINGLLQLSRTGRVDMKIQKIDMNALLATIVQSLDFQIKEAQCKIHLNPLPECYGDAALLDQLFTNIISNALKYSDSQRALEISVEAKKIYNRVIYTIRDTGKGMAEKHLEKIWDVFYRIDPRSSKAGEGIGLSLVKRIAEKHIGKVWAESEENKGSVFYIELHDSSFSEF